MKYKSDHLLLTVDLMGVFLFAIEGASAAIRHNLDFFGVMVLSFATALGGGVIRDLLIGATPPSSIKESRYALVAFSGGAVVFSLHFIILDIPPALITTLDAAGLGLFATVGAVKAHDYKINGVLSVLMGVITGVGGGTTRDIFLAQVPAVLQVDVYAVAALAGALVTIVGIRYGYSRRLVMTLGAIVCFLLRVVSVWRGWNLPKAISVPFSQ